MKYSYNWLKELSKTKLSPGKLAEVLTMHFAEVEELKREGEDFILDIDVRPNRAADCFSHIGIAREIAAITDLNFQEPIFIIKENKELRTKDFVNVEVKNKSACPRYTARVVTDVKVGPSPKYIRDKLKVCGLRPINNIVDIANYVMLETGQPLHAFDGERIESRKIIVRFAKEGEKIITLDGERYNLFNDILVISDAEKPIAIAGIKGGLSAEIDSRTKTIILESANFTSKIIRRGSKMIDLKTDASLRFEHGISPDLTEFAINRVAYLIQKTAGGKIVQGLIDVYPKKVLSQKIKLDLDYAKSLLGREIPKKEIIRILKNLDFGVEILSKDNLKIKVPTRRLDVSLSEDLIEEIGRIYGYQNIPNVFPRGALIPPKRNIDIFWEDLTKDVLKEAGFTEFYNYSFISKKDAEIFKYNKELIEIENPISEDSQYLRPTLIPNLLKNIERNFRNFGEIKIFELGKIFQFPKTEKRILSGLMTGELFYQAKGAVDLLLNRLGISDIYYSEYQIKNEKKEIFWWYPKKVAEIKAGQERIGFLGEISPHILEKFQIKSKVIYFEIFFEKLAKLASEEKEYRPISRYPAAVRDIAVLVPQFVKVEEVLNKIEATGGKIIKNIDLFDIYQGEELPKGKKNLAFHIIYQAEDRTLSSEEIDEIQNKIIKTLEKIIEWQVRKQ
jgi:phenylalanyl-tRNA synthetase beta chain